MLRVGTLLGALSVLVARADPRDEFGPSFGLAHAVFTPAECEAIVALMEAKATRERDHRPSHGVSRTNYGDADGRLARDEPAFAWVLDRLLARLDPAGAGAWGFARAAVTRAEFALSHVGFVLMHDFGGDGFFDWHVDTKPGDGTGRTLNVNVLLSARDDFAGGALQVGQRNVTAARGDAYYYPAAHAHKVCGGLRARAPSCDAAPLSLSQHYDRARAPSL